MKYKDFAKIVAEFRADGSETPCADSPDWTSEDVNVRRRAAVLCADCPLRRACRNYGTYASNAWGVYGGRDFASSGAPRVEDPPELVAQVRLWRAQGWTRQQIAERLDIPVTKLDSFLRRHNLIVRNSSTAQDFLARARRVVELHDDNHLTFVAIAARLGVTERQVQYSYQQAKAEVAA